MLVKVLLGTQHVISLTLISLSVSVLNLVEVFGHFNERPAYVCVDLSPPGGHCLTEFQSRLSAPHHLLHHQAVIQALMRRLFGDLYNHR